MDCLARCTPVWRQGFRERGDELFARRVHWRPVGLRKTLYQATGHPSAGTDWGGAHGATGRGDSLDTTACASVRTASLARSTIAAAGGVGRVLAWERGARWLGGAGRGGGHLQDRAIAPVGLRVRPDRRRAPAPPLTAQDEPRDKRGRRFHGLHDPPMPNSQRALPAGRRTPGRRDSTDFEAEEREGADAVARSIPIAPDPRRVIQDAVVADDVNGAWKTCGSRADKRGDQDADKGAAGGAVARRPTFHRGLSGFALPLRSVRSSRSRSQTVVAV
jgi:hypothetical protein